MKKNVVRIILAIFLCFIFLPNSVIFAVENNEEAGNKLKELLNKNENTVNLSENNKEEWKQYQDSFPTIIVGNARGGLGEVIEVPIKIKSVQHITSGGITFQYDKKLEFLECIPNGIYITSYNVNDGKVSVAFMADSVQDYEVDVCILKFKIPSNYEGKETKVSLYKVNSLYSNDEFIGFYRNEDAIIEVEHIKIFDARRIAVIIDIIVAAILLKVFISKIKEKRKQRKEKENIEKEKAQTE